MTSYEKVTEAILAELDKGVVPWRKPWAGGFVMPRSMATGNTYNGINVLLLGSRPYSSAWWGTYRQIKKQGGQVMKGQKGTGIVFWKFIDEKGEDGQPTGSKIPLLRTFSVFNAEQAEWADGMPEKFAPAPVDGAGEHTPLEAVEAMIAGYEHGPKVDRQGTRAFYSPATDSVVVPPSESFFTAEGEFGTMAHELVHSTGHKSRLDRDFNGSFGSDPYAREELVAEIGAAFLAAEFGVGCDDEVKQSAAYIASWRKKIAEDDRLIVKAAGQAAKAVARIREGADAGRGAND